MSFRRVLSPAFQIWARKYCPPYPLQTQLHSPWDLAAFDGIGPCAGQNLASLVPQQHRVRKQRFETVFAGQLVLCDAMCNSGAGFYTPILAAPKREHERFA